MATYARNPVEFVRGEGTRLWDDEGNEYLDFLAGISVAQLGHCHPRVVEAVREQAGRLMHVGNLYYTEPGMRLAKRLADLLARRPRLPLQLRRRGDRVRAEARPQAPPGRRVRRAWRAASTAAPWARSRPRRRRPSRRRSRRSCRASRWCPATTARRSWRAVTGRHRRGPARADPGRVAASTRSTREVLARRPRGLRRARRAAHLRRDPVRHGPHRHAVGARAAGRGARRDDGRQGPGRRACRSARA